MIIGHLGADPESRSFQNGGKVVNLRVATSESWKDRNTGEKKESTQWHQIAIFAEHSGDFAEKYLRKGHKVYIEGQLETRKWQDQQGNDRYSTEIVIRPYSGTVTSLQPADRSADSRGYDDRGQGGGQRQRGDGGGDYRDGNRGRGGGRSGGQGGFGGDFGSGGHPFGDDLDDDVPF